LYTFCRRVDDAIDLCPPNRQAQALAELHVRLDSIYAEDAQPDIPWQAFADLTRAVALPRAYPDELLHGMQMDVEGHAYRNLDDLLAYCHRVAGVVGLMLCHVFGISRESALRNAAHLGIAMQITNICRDVAEDWERGRLYLPGTELERAGIGTLGDALGKPLPDSAAAPLSRVLESLLREADRFYRSADRGLSALPFRAALAVRAARHVYAAIGGRLRARHYDVRRGRAVVSATQKLGIVLYSACASLAEVPTRLVRSRSYQAPSRVARFPEDVLP
jgi:15-cis-phytoene synthase